MSFNRDFWRNEEHRWSYMSDSQLLTRLYKITKQPKLEAYIAMARRKNKSFLEQRAIARYEELFESFEVSKRVTSRPDVRISKTTVQQREVVLTIINQRVQIQVEDMDRALDF